MATRSPRPPRANRATRRAASTSRPDANAEPFDATAEGPLDAEVIDGAADDEPIPEEGPLTPSQAERALIADLDAGQPWYPALLRVVARWVAPEEEVDGERYHYLIGGEAFDWLLLAQRLLDAAGDRVPEAEREALLRFGVPPGGEDEEAFEQGIGPAKHRAHLNYQYGVVVEEALLLAAEQELRKAGRLSRSADRDADFAAYERVYGRPFEELRAIYRLEAGADLGERVSLAELREFTYWCSKYRVQSGEPELVASDTRKALALLSQMALRRGAPAARSGVATAGSSVIDESGESAPERPSRETLPPRPGGNGRRAPRPERRRGSPPPARSKSARS